MADLPSTMAPNNSLNESSKSKPRPKNITLNEVKHQDDIDFSTSDSAHASSACSKSDDSGIEVIPNNEVCFVVYLHCMPMSMWLMLA